MVSIELMDWIVMVSYSIVVITFFSIGIIFIRKSKDKPNMIKKYILGIGIFFILYGISRITMFTFEWSFPIVANTMSSGALDPGFIWNYSSDEIAAIFLTYQNINIYHDIIWRSTTGLGTIGLALLMFRLEQHILQKKAKFIFTIIEILSVIHALIVGVAESGKDEVTFVRLILYIGNAMMIVMPLIYLYLAFKTSGDTRKNALLATSGILIMFMGIIFNSSIGKSIFAGQVMVQYMLFGVFVLFGSIIYLRAIKY